MKTDNREAFTKGGKKVIAKAKAVDLSKALGIDFSQQSRGDM